MAPTANGPVPALLWPLDGPGHPTQEFGERLLDYSRFGLYADNGLDLGAETGTPVVATHDGQAWVYTDPGGYGQVVELWTPTRKAGAGYKTISAHLSGWAVKDGALVTAGQVIGFVGSTGNSTGPHLHFGVKLLYGRNPGYRDWVDPRPYLPVKARRK